MLKVTRLLRIEKEAAEKAKKELGTEIKKYKGLKAFKESLDREKVALEEWKKRLELAELRILKRAGDLNVSTNIKELLSNGRA